jgi:hypothetical protein
MSWTGVQVRQPGDVIIIDDHNLLIQALDGLFGYVHVENTPQPIQVNKPSILLLEGEAATTPDLPIGIHVFESADDITYEEVAGADIIPDGNLHVVSLTVPIPENYFVSWIAPYGFVKSAILF